jgi:hypothetical protein
MKDVNRSSATDELRRIGESLVAEIMAGKLPARRLLCCSGRSLDRFL